MGRLHKLVESLRKERAAQFNLEHEQVLVELPSYVQRVRAYPVDPLLLNVIESELSELLQKRIGDEAFAHARKLYQVNMRRHNNIGVVAFFPALPALVYLRRNPE